MSEGSSPRSEPGCTAVHRGEAAIWTDRMLAALDNGVRGGKWHSLIDKVYAPATLNLAWRKVRANRGAAGVDGISVARFEAQHVRYLSELHSELKRQGYRPQPVKRVMVPKGDGKERPLGIPTVKDRVVQTAIKLVLEPIFEREFSSNSYGFRPGRGAKDALRAVTAHLAGGAGWVVDADIEGYFDAIDHGLLMAMLKERIADQALLRLIESYLKQDVLEGAKAWRPTQGSPQGAVLSPLLANIYLSGLDSKLEQSHRIVRYADDFVILCHSEEEAAQALLKVRRWMTDHRLTLHREKTGLRQESCDGFDFLGYTFCQGSRYPRVKAVKGLRDKIRQHTRRQPGKSIKAVIADLNPVLRGWFEYFKHAHPRTFGPIDGFVRRRLRSILRKFHKCKGGTGRNVRDHVAWPNAFFAKLRLFTLQEAFVHASKSRC